MVNFWVMWIHGIHRIQRLLESPWCRTWRSTLGCSSIGLLPIWTSDWRSAGHPIIFSQKLLARAKKRRATRLGWNLLQCHLGISACTVGFRDKFINQKGCCNQNSVPFFNDNCTYMILYQWHGTNCNTHFLGTEGSGSAVSNIIRIYIYIYTFIAYVYIWDDWTATLHQYIFGMGSIRHCWKAFDWVCAMGGAKKWPWAIGEHDFLFSPWDFGCTISS